MKELFEIVDEQGNIIGQALREECHRNPCLLHRVSHVLVFNSQGSLYLQKRSINKDIQPGKWDTSVGGHLNEGETHEDAGVREMAEELGICGVAPIYLYDYIWRSDRESEMVRTFMAIYDGEISYSSDEIETGRFWTLDEIKHNLNTGIFTPNFEVEYEKYGKMIGAR
ncbi:NUDIX domain-containing protein [Candidatus Desantisbacteria bacterium]|nr:NUDIX domain-containing protein [Candidatus Desantisbacteria bacterium]